MQVDGADLLFLVSLSALLLVWRLAGRRIFVIFFVTFQGRLGFFHGRFQPLGLDFSSLGDEHIEEFIEDHGFSFSCLLLSQPLREETSLVSDKLVKIVQLCLKGTAGLERSLLFDWRSVGILGIL